MSLFQRIINAAKLVSFGSSGPGAIPRPLMTDDTTFDRETITELLKRTPRMPSEVYKEPANINN